MSRGVDTQLSCPDLQPRVATPLAIGYVGRQPADKNVRLLASVERALSAAGINDFTIDIAGSGSERD